MSPPPPAFLPPAPKQNNVAAIVSLISGILSCIPGASLLAIILGIVGLAKAGKPNVGGKGLAIAGLLLGLIGTLGWVGGVTAITLKARAVIAQGAPARAVAKQFATDVGRGDADAALRDCSSSINADKVRAAVAQAQPWGALQDTTFVALNFNNQNGAKSVTVGGVAVFANAKKTFTATLDQEDGAYRITDFNFADQQ
jgi:hypothetical protein